MLSGVDIDWTNLISYREALSAQAVNAFGRIEACIVPCLANE